MREPDGTDRINMSRIPVAGIGGLGLIGVVIIMAVAFPAARALLVGGLAGGLLIAASLIAWRRAHVPSGPSGDNPAILFREAAVSSERERVRPLSRGEHVAIAHAGS
jgi:hypothetical protein